MYSYPEIRAFLGLYLQANSFGVPDGALEQAQNVVISKDGIVSKARGSYAYFVPGSGTLNRLFNFQATLVAAYGTKLVYYSDTGSSPNETGSEHTLSGATVAITGTRVSRSLQSNNNLYLTTDNGLLKLTAYNATILKSGAPQGLDVNARFLNGSLSTWLASGMTVGYRVIFGYQDANDNLILGAPSDTVTITNTAVTGKAASAAGTTITVTSTSHGLATGQYLVVSGGAGFTDAANNAKVNGNYQITVVDANSFTYTVASGPSGGPGTVNYCYGMPVRLEFSVPSEVTSSVTWFYQVYRSSQQSGSIFSDFKLIEQDNLTAGQLSSSVVFFTDDTDDTLLGAELYTNENSREGELQANYRAPLCDDVTLYKNHAIYGQCTTRHLLSLALIDTTVIASTDYIEQKVDSTTRRYVARTGVGNQTVRATCSSSTGLLVTSTAHGFSNGDTVYAANQTGGSLADGTYYVVSKTANTFKLSLTNGGSAVAYNSETSVEIQGVTDGTNPIFYLSQSGSASIRLRDTAQALVKAINRDTSSLVYASYASGPNDVPGKMRFQEKGFGGAIYMRASSDTVGGGFSPVLPSSFGAGTQVYSRNDLLPHVFYSSKANEPEAVPLVNFFTVGAKNKSILRIHALRDSLIILKEDGVFRMTGDDVTNFTVTLLDGTVQIVAASSSDVINNQVVFLSNQGVCLVTESSVQIISRKIEDVIQPILGQTNIATVSGGVAYESERLYLLTTSEPNTTTATQTYAYNTLTDGWTTWTTQFTQGVIGPGNVLYLITTANVINKERKKQTKLDYCGQNYTVTIGSVSSDGLSCQITFATAIVPQRGDIVVKNNVVNRIATTPTFVSGNTYAVTFRLASNLANSDSLQLYSRYESIIKTAPFHAGLVGRSKHFGQMQIHPRDDSVSRLTISFLGNFYGGSEEVTWVTPLTSAGWGFFPWGFEPWGQQDGINLTQGTRPAGVIRVYVPRYAARGTFLQPYISHVEAAEPLNLQAMSFAVRALNERTTR